MAILDGITPADAARARLEPKVLGLFRQCFARDDVGPDDSFFALGGDSLQATRLLARVREACAAELPPEAIFLHPTPRELAAAAAALAASAPAAGGSATLLPLNRGGEGRPLHLFHATSGSPWVYRALVEHAGFRRPVLGFRAPDLDWTRDVLSMRGMVEHYAAELRRAQRRGPYALAGFSFGGNLAFEVAHRLLADGEEVEHLVMIDTNGPRPLRHRMTSPDYLLAPLRRRLVRRGASAGRLLRATGLDSPMGQIFLCFGTGPLEEREVRWILTGMFPNKARKLPLDRMSLAELCDAAVRLFNPPLTAAEWEHLARRDPSEDALVLVKAQKVWAKNHWLSLNHRPRARYPGTIVIFAARENRTVLRWQRHAARPLDVRWVDVPAEKHTRFIDAEYLPAFIADFRALLEPEGAPPPPAPAAAREEALHV